MRPQLVALCLLFPLTAQAQERLSDQPATAGRYQPDPAHAWLLMRVNHLGFSHCTATIQTFDANLAFDPDHPEPMTITATVDPASLETFSP